MFIAILGYLLAGICSLLLLLRLGVIVMRGFLGFIGALIGGIAFNWLFELPALGVVIGLLLGWFIHYRMADDDEAKKELIGDWLTLIIGGSLSFFLAKIDIGDMVCPRDGHAAWVVFVVTLPVLICGFIPFYRFLPAFTPSSESIRISDIKYISKNRIVEVITGNPFIKPIICLAFALLVYWIFFGTRLLFKFDVYFVEPPVKVMVFFYAHAIMNILLSLFDYEEWKIHTDPFKGIYGLAIGITLYIYLGVLWKDNPPVYEGSWLQQLRDGLASVFDWIGGFLPDWFFADGWLGLWELFRGLVSGLVSLFFVSVLFSIPFAIIYEVWHNRRDMPSTSYEWTAVLVLFPIYVYANSWFIYMGHTSGWFSKAFLLFISFITFFYAACGRGRCPYCGSSKCITLEDEYKKYRDVEHTRSETERVFCNGQEIGKHKTDSYRQEVEKHQDWYCQRCGEKWHSVRISDDSWNTKEGWGNEKSDFPDL